MEEVDPRQFRTGINLKDSFLRFVRNSMNRLSTSIFMDKRLGARSKNSFL